MVATVLKLIAILGLPLSLFKAGVAIMDKLADGPYVSQRLERAAPPADQTPLNRRLKGYDVQAVNRHWGALHRRAREAERLFLELDLVFPFLYGGGLAAGLLIAWAMVGRPWHPAWFIVPVVVAVLADWTENLVQISQLERYVSGSETSLQAGWVRVASVATSVKALFLIGLSLSLFGMFVAAVVRTVKPG